LVRSADIPDAAQPEGKIPASPGSGQRGGYGAHSLDSGQGIDRMGGCSV